MRTSFFARSARAVSRSAVLLTLVLGLAIASQAQSTRGVITGIVQDSTGAALPNAEVTLKSPTQGTSVVVKTNSVGLYRFEGVNVGDAICSGQGTMLSAARR